MFGRIGSNGEGNSDPRKTSLVLCSGSVPSKYWAESENPEWEPEYIEGDVPNPAYDPDVPEFIYTNDFVQMVEDKPEVVDAEVQADGTWLDVTPVEVNKQNAYDTTLEGLEAKKSEENLKDFVYNENTYLSDKASIQATQNEALAGVSTESIHTLVGTPYAGCWAAVGTFVPFTNAEFLLLATEFFKRGSDNFTTRSVHKMNLDAMLASTEATAEDILNYDYSTGWH